MSGVAEERKRLIDGRADYPEIRWQIKADGRYTRAIALIALSRWILAHPNYQADSELLADLVSAALDSHSHADQWLAGSNISARDAAFGCLADVGTSEALQALQHAMKTLNLDKKAKQHLEAFLRERPDHYLW